ncbi:MAG TPA: SusC/RagA family TonB-linked outer membrane protein [Longimicrobiales bacterium]
MRAKHCLCALLLGLLAPPALDAQSVGQITGVVTSDAGVPLQNATVVVQGTQLGAVTSSNGRYVILNVPAGQHVVEVSLIGYATQRQTVTVVAGAPAIADFRLEAEALALEEVVVIGYGTQERQSITGAVASIRSADFVQGPARDAASLIRGKVPGLAVSTPSGNPTEGSEISLRGITTITGSTAPLVLVDGVPGSLTTVAPQDIESISVLKDGSAAAIYGTRGSNGVILITTKRYVGGAPTIRYDGDVTYSTIYRRPDFLTADDYRRLIAEGYEFEDLGFNTDWQDQVLRNPLSQRHNLTITGGATNTNYTASLSYENREGIFLRSDNRLLTARANIRHAMFDGRLSVEANLVSRTQTRFDGVDYNYVWRQALIRNPTDRMRQEDGLWQERGTYFYTNPLGLIHEVNGEREIRTQRLHGTLTYMPFDGMRLSIMGGTSRSSDLRGGATTFKHVQTTQSGNNGTAWREAQSDVDRILEITGTYDRDIGDHSFTLLGGYSYQDFVDEGFDAYNFDFPTDLFSYNQLGQGSALTEGRADMGSYKSSYKLIGFFGRLNYDWRNRFLFMASVRYEGNSRFGADHKWGLFPAVSAGWRISEERFMDGLPWVDDLRLRVGFGVTGIAPNQSYQSLTSYEYDDRFLYDGEWVQGIEPARNPNPDLRWEQKEEINVGLNFSLFDQRLNGEFDVYRRDTYDMLYEYDVPVPPYLYDEILANVGHMRNDGMEAALSYDVIRGDRLRWTTSVNGSTNRNKLVSLSDETFRPDNDFFYAGHTGEPIQMVTHRIDIGGPIGNFYGYKSVDIDENGEWIVLNRDGEPIPIRDVTEDDRHVLGNGIPKYYAAWNNTVQFGNLDFSLNMRGAFGFQILNFQRMYYENPTILQYNMLESAFEPVYGKRLLDYDLAYVSYYVEDGDYWKVDNATLGYTFSPSALGLLGSTLSNLRVYLTGRNLFTITGYKGLDPEVRTTGLAPGTDHRDKYPTTRTFTLGVTATF